MSEGYLQSMARSIDGYINTFIVSLVVGTVVIGTLRYGPIDLARTIYNTATGDSFILHRSLEEYCGKIKSKDDVAKILHVDWTHDGKRPRVQDASLEDLWDCAEENSDASLWERNVWTPLRR